MTEGQSPGHGLRCCWIGLHIGQAIGLRAAELGDLYYALLLKDLGCSSNAARICALYLADDRGFKHDFKLVGDGLPQALRFVLSHTGLKAGFAERVRAIVAIVQNGGEIARDLIETRCQRGADIARRMRFSEAVASGIRDLDEHWDGGGKPLGLRGEAISLFARIALLAQVVDVFHTSAGEAGAVAELRRRRGIWFDPALVDAFVRISLDRGFWTGLTSPDLEAALFDLEPGQRRVALDDGYLDDIAAAFAQVVDAKSPFTHGHSQRVALFAVMTADRLGLSPERRRWLRRAALLHDIGKLGVSNQVLDKAGPLDDAEWAQMRTHPGAGAAILSRIDAFAGMARVAAGHHERLDGRGYPSGLKGEAIDLETRIVSVADVFDALTAERPYRAAMPPEQAFAIMERDAGTAFDPACLAALREAVAAFDSFDHATGSPT
ncbi:HD-GYP domain-containing protein [Salinarimonas soli]|nr:HD-GYP domain-containing protein [Salinarimonas soli]